MNPDITRFIFDRIPALGELRGVARLNAEDVIENAIDDAIEEYLADCETDVVIEDYLADCGPGVDGEETVVAAP